MANKKIDIALYQPEIAGNVGSIIRSCACFNANLHIIEPCGFPFDVKKIKKSALDYFNKINIIRHNSFDIFYQNEVNTKSKRLILATTKGDEDLRNFTFKQNDIILFGQESCGVDLSIHQKCDHRVYINMQNNMRSINLAVSCGIFLSHI